MIFRASALGLPASFFITGLVLLVFVNEDKQQMLAQKAKRIWLIVFIICLVVGFLITLPNVR